MITEPFAPERDQLGAPVLQGESGPQDGTNVARYLFRSFVLPPAFISSSVVFISAGLALQGNEILMGQVESCPYACAPVATGDGLRWPRVSPTVVVS